MLATPAVSPQVNHTAELLLMCLKTVWTPTNTARLTELTTAQWQALVDWALQQKVAALFYYRLRQHGLDEMMPAPIRKQLKSYYQQLAVNNLTLYHQLRSLVAGLHEQQIPVMLLKGAYLGGAVYEDRALRQMVDVDLLVTPEALVDAIAVVTALGYQPTQPIDAVQPYLAHKHHLPPFVKEGKCSLEIHWTITQPNLSYTIEMADLWARAQPATVAGIEVKVLAPEDLLLHICLHATYQHGLEQDIRFLCDIDAICRRFAPTFDWTQFMQRAEQWGWARGVYLALYLAHDLLDTPLPHPILQTLQSDQAAIRLVLESKAYLAGGRLPNSYLVSPDFCEAWQEKQLIHRVHKALQRVFLSRAALACIYPVAPDSPKIYFYYLVRLKDLLVRYSPMLYQLQRKQPEVTVFERKAALIAWLENGARNRNPFGQLVVSSGRQKSGRV